MNTSRAYRAIVLFRLPERAHRAEYYWISSSLFESKPTRNTYRHCAPPPLDIVTRKIHGSCFWGITSDWKTSFPCRRKISSTPLRRFVVELDRRVDFVRELFFFKHRLRIMKINRIFHEQQQQQLLVFVYGLRYSILQNECLRCCLLFLV